MGQLERIEAKLDVILSRLATSPAQVATDELLNVQRISTINGLHPNTIRRMCESGEYKTAKKQGRSWFVLKSEVLNLKSK